MHFCISFDRQVGRGGPSRGQRAFFDGMAHSYGLRLVLYSVLFRFYSVPMDY